MVLSAVHWFAFLPDVTKTLTRHKFKGVKSRTQGFGVESTIEGTNCFGEAVRQCPMELQATFDF